MKIQFITASHDMKIREENIMKSPIFNVELPTSYSLPPLRAMLCFDNIPKAYNTAMRVCKASDIYVFLHHDVYLPASFEKQLLQALEIVPDDWGVLGIAGVVLNGKKENYGHLLDRKKIWGNPDNLPQAVDTLDEVLLITYGDLLFDENLPLDFYGADICMQAKQNGKKCYAINAFCHHNSSRKLGGRTESFYESEKYFKEKWRDCLPIATTCALIEA